MAKYNAFGIIVLAGGGLLVYSAIAGKGFSQATRAVLAGQSPSTAPSANPIIDYSLLSSETGQSQGNIQATLGGPAANSSDAKNQAIVKNYAAALGWTGQQWTALNNIIMAESGYNNQAQNPSSSAYGIFQFLDTTWQGTGYSKTSNPVVQTLAGLAYIKARYGNPVNAWNFHLANGWY